MCSGLGGVCHRLTYYKTTRLIRDVPALYNRKNYLVYCQHSAACCNSSVAMCQDWVGSQSRSQLSSKFYDFGQDSSPNWFCFRACLFIAMRRSGASFSCSCRKKNGLLWKYVPLYMCNFRIAKAYLKKI